MKWLLKFSGFLFVIAQLGGFSNLPAQEAPGAKPKDTPPTTTPAAKPKQPRIQFSETTFNFGKVKPTDTLKHDFIVTNIGEAVLEITAVQPGCGCTTAGAWDRAIEPGKTGKIPIQFNPANFSGTVGKSVTVTCNDPVQATHFLQINATIWRPIDAQPQFVYFMPVAGEETNETRIVRIVNNLEQDVTLQPPTSTSPVFKTELKTVRPGKEFELQITYSGPASNATPHGTITINTSSTDVPVLNVTATAMPQPAVVVFPASIQLPAGPFTKEYQTTATIRNNSRSPVKLTDPTIGIESVKVQVQELDPGKLFTVKLSFPAGFQARVDQPMELDINTTHPKAPVLKVPITQLPAATLVPQPGPVTQPAVSTGGTK